MNGEWQAAGLASWKHGVGNAILLQSGHYGQTNYNVRVSHYLGWIESVIKK